ncbi:MAG: tetratricopeptide repeat protein [Phycisphaerae bacterium]
MGKQLTKTLLSASVIAVIAGCAQNNQKTASSIQSPQWKEGYELPTPSEQGNRSLTEPKILPKTHFAAGQLLEAKGMIDDAIVQYQKAIAVNHTYGEAYQALGILYAQIGRNNDAIESMTKAVSLCPTDALARNNLGYLMMRNGRWAEAKQHLVKATKIQPYFARAHVNLGMCLSKLGRFEEAYESFRTVLPKADAKYNLGLMYRGQQRYEEAAQAFRDVLRVNPQFVAAEDQLVSLQPFLAPPVESEEQIASEGDDEDFNNNAQSRSNMVEDRGQQNNQTTSSSTATPGKNKVSQRNRGGVSPVNNRRNRNVAVQNSCPEDEAALQACMSYDIEWCEDENLREASRGVMMPNEGVATDMNWPTSALRSFAQKQNTMKAKPSTSKRGNRMGMNDSASSEMMMASASDWHETYADFDYEVARCHELFLTDASPDDGLFVPFINQMEKIAPVRSTMASRPVTSSPSTNAAGTTDMTDSVVQAPVIENEVMMYGVEGFEFLDGCGDEEFPHIQQGTAWAVGGVTFDDVAAMAGEMPSSELSSMADASTWAAVVDQVNLIDHADIMQTSRQTLAMRAISPSNTYVKTMARPSKSVRNMTSGYASIHTPVAQNPTISLRESLASMTRQQIEARLVQVRDEIRCLDNDLATLYGPYRQNVSMSDLALDYVPGMDWTIVTMSPMEQATYQALHEVDFGSVPEEVPVPRGRETMSMTVTESKERKKSSECDAFDPQGTNIPLNQVQFDNLLTLIGLAADGNTCWDVETIQQYLSQEQSKATNTEDVNFANKAAKPNSNAGRVDDSNKFDNPAPDAKSSHRGGRQPNQSPGMGDNYRSKIDEDRHWIHRTSTRRRSSPYDPSRRLRTSRYRLGHRHPDQIIDPE